MHLPTKASMLSATVALRHRNGMRQIFFLDTGNHGLGSCAGSSHHRNRLRGNGGQKTHPQQFLQAHPPGTQTGLAVEVHGITLESLEDAPKFAEIASEFMDFVHDAEVVIHNAPFDVGFLDSELAVGSTRVRIARSPIRWRWRAGCIQARKIRLMRCATVIRWTGAHLPRCADGRRAFGRGLSP